MMVPLAAVAAAASYAIAAGSPAAAATPAAATADPNAAVVQKSAQDPAAVAKYWTPAAMRAAKEVQAPRPAPSAAKVPAQTFKLPAQAASGAVPAKGTGPGRVMSPAVDVTQSQVWTTHGSMPATTVGKLYFTEPSGNFQCTASVVNSQNHSLIWTAGHCVTDGSQHWYSNFRFVPDYHDGVSPLGSWSWKSVSTPSAYFNGANYDYDLAAITLWPTNGVKVADRTGYQGYKFNYGYVWHAYEFGYPADTHPARSGIDANQLRYCLSTTWQTGGQQAIHCDQGHGSSGGPWLDDLQLSRGWGYLVGNVSHHNSDSSDVENGPHFGDAAVNVYNAQTNA
jgi:hypothetical protein